MTHSSPSRTALVRMPATSEPAPGSVMPSDEIFLPWIEGTRYFCLSSSEPNLRIGGVAMSVCTAMPITRPPQLAAAIASPRTIDMK